MFGDNEHIDPVTAAAHMDPAKLEAVGGRDFLLGIVEACPSIAGAARYAHIVREHAIRRDLVRAGHALVDIGSTPGEKTLEELLEEAETLVYRVRRETTQREQFDMRQLMNDAVDAMFNPQDPRHYFLRTGYMSLDELVGGVAKGALMILGARPSVGKTALGLNISTMVTKREERVLFFSLEMSRAELAQRLISSESEIGLTSIRCPNGMTPDELAEASAVAGKLAELPLIIDDDAGMTIPGIRARIRREVTSRGLGLVVVDYLQLISPGAGRRAENRQNEVADMSRQLKVMAKEFNVPILCLSQLSRPMKDAKERKPHLEDLRDSGAIEQDADVVVFLHRSRGADPRDPTVEVLVRKNRNGPTGEFSLMFMPHLVRFYDVGDSPRGTISTPPAPDPYDDEEIPDPQESML